MKHIDFEMLYHLAECAGKEQSFNDVEEDAMRHIADCRDCYEKFCSLAAIMSVTGNDGYAVLSNIFVERGIGLQDEKISNQVMAVISITIHRVKESVSIIMEQAEPIKQGFVFEAPFAVAARDVSDHADTGLGKLEDIENERTFITVDPVSQELLVQIDADGLESSEPIAYIVLENGDRTEMILSRAGAVFRGKMNNVPEERFALYLAKKSARFLPYN